jgi:putative ABC transport system ATP-binding protein
MIHFQEVAKHYRHGKGLVRALDGISLEIPAGRLALVQGASGSGKTTLINLAAGLTRPSSGAIRVAGENFEGMGGGDLNRLRARRVAVVFQMFHLVPYLSAYENVLLPTLAAAKEENAPDRARKLLEDLGLEERADHFPSELSAGERQRCAVARALLNRPDVILADEPTGNLDTDSAALVLAQLDACRQAGATVLLVSHQHIDRITADLEFRIEAGKLAA